MLHTVRFFSLQNAVYFIMLPFLVPVLFTFYIQGLLKLKKNSGVKGLRVGQISHFFLLLVNRDVFLQWCEIIVFPRRKRILNAGKTGDSTEIAFVNKEEDLTVPTGQPGSQSHLPKLRNHQHNQLSQTQGGIFLIPPSSATSQVVVMMLEYHGRLQTLELMKQRRR